MPTPKQKPVPTDIHPHLMVSLLSALESASEDAAVILRLLRLGDVADRAYPQECAEVRRGCSRARNTIGVLLAKLRGYQPPAEAPPEGEGGEDRA
ncbi:MAG: hypothetical protein KGL39_31005 [Patescibacteria group bacterium]|nr:hypothetical protein [Patescibacteria group bacterium]